MPFEIYHFRDSEKILENKNMLNDVQETLQYIQESLYGSLYHREIFKQVLQETGWIADNGNMNILEGRRYRWKGYKKSIAIEGNFSAYEYILEGSFKLQIGYDKGIIEAGILLLNAKRSWKSPYYNISAMINEDIELLYPTISLPISIALFNLGEPTIV